MDKATSFKKDANADEPKNVHLIVWPAGTAESWLQKNYKCLVVNLERTYKLMLLQTGNIFWLV